MTTHGTYGDPGYFREVDGTPHFFYGTPGSGTPHWATEQPSSFRIRTKSGDHMIEAKPAAGGGHDVTHTKPGGAVETAHHATKAAAIRDIGDRAYEVETAAKASGEHVETGGAAEPMREKAPPSPPASGEFHRNSMGVVHDRGIDYTAGQDSGPVSGRKLLWGTVKKHPEFGEVVEFQNEKVGKKEIVPMLRTAGRPELKELADKYSDRQSAKQQREKWRPTGYDELATADRAAENELHRHGRAFNRMMEDEQNDGVRPPDPVDESKIAKAEELRSMYPVAHLYRLAERQMGAANSNKAIAGLNALEMIRNGAHPDDVRSKLENWLPSGYVD